MVANINMEVDNGENGHLSSEKQVFGWGRGNRLILTASQLPITADKPDLYDLTWGNSIYYAPTRKLINEASGIFFVLQKLQHDDANKKIYQQQLIKISRKYRSVIKACIGNSQLAADSCNDADLKAIYECLSQTFYKIELIWSFCEILFIDIQSGGAVLVQLLNWIKLHFPEFENIGNDIMKHDLPENHPQYWDTIYVFILQGRLDAARKLLKLHANRENNSFLILDELLSKMPTFPGHFAADFEMKWHSWQEQCKQNLQDGEYLHYKELKIIYQILCGELTVFPKMASLCETWYHLLVSRLLYTNPTVKGCDLHYFAEECIDLYGGRKAMNTLDIILFSFLEFDVIQAVKEISNSFDNWWFVAHLTDLLYHCKQLGIEEYSSNYNMREYLLVDFTTSLMSHESLWQVGAMYFGHCDQRGKQELEKFLHHIPLDSNWKVQKIRNIAEKHGITEYVDEVCKIAGVQALHEKSLGTSLSWALKSKDAALINLLADRFLLDYGQKGLLSIFDFVDNIGASLLLSDRLTFLGKYREFHRLYEDKEYSSAASLLVSLLSAKLAPISFWITLLMDALPLLESTENCINSEQTYELLYCLEELEKQNDGVNEADKIAANKKVDLVRLALSRNLARSLLLEKSEK